MVLFDILINSKLRESLISIDPSSGKNVTIFFNEFADLYL